MHLVGADDHEVLAQHRDVDRRAHRGEVGQRAAEPALLGEHADDPRARLGVGAGELGRVGDRRQLALRRAAPLDLRDPRRCPGRAARPSRPAAAAPRTRALDLGEGDLGLAGREVGPDAVDDRTRGHSCRPAGGPRPGTGRRAPDPRLPSPALWRRSGGHRGPAGMLDPGFGAGRRGSRPPVERVPGPLPVGVGGARAAPRGRGVPGAEGQPPLAGITARARAARAEPAARHRAARVRPAVRPRSSAGRQVRRDGARRRHDAGGRRERPITPSRRAAADRARRRGEQREQGRARARGRRRAGRSRASTGGRPRAAGRPPARTAAPSSSTTTDPQRATGARRHPAAHAGLAQPPRREGATAARVAAVATADSTPAPCSGTRCPRRPGRSRPRCPPPACT